MTYFTITTKAGKKSLPSGAGIREQAATQMVRILILLALLGTGGAAILLFDQDSQGKQALTLLPRGGEIHIPLAQLAENRASFFHYYFANRKLRPAALVAWRSSADTASVVLDACKNCYKFHTGYHQSGARLKCLHCGQEFRLGEAKSPSQEDCYPLSVKSSIRSNQLVISTKVLEDSLSYFNPAADDRPETFNISEGGSR